jgi:hypothetical protein
MRQSGRSVGIAGLERRARLAGEAFGYEEIGLRLPIIPATGVQLPLKLLALSVLATIAAIALVTLR